jgi:nuclear pore complex protein Nup54
MATSYLLRTCFALVSLRFEDEVIMYHILLLKFDVGYLGQQATGSLFGQTQSLFGQTPQTPTFGQTPQTPVFGQTQPQAQSSLFGGQPQQTSIFGQPQASQATFVQQQPSVLQSQPFGIPQQQSPFFNNAQITTQMAPIAPLVVPLPDREIQAIVDAYKDEPGNPQYAFKHLLLSVTDPAARVKPVGVSDIMWAEAMNKLEGMDSTDRERLWPELVHGFKDLSRRVKLQDEAITADVQRLQATEANVKLVHVSFSFPVSDCHFLCEKKTF